MKVKKCISILAAAAVICCMKLMPAAAESEFDYVLLEDGSAAVTWTDTSATQVQVPASVDGHPVTALSDGCFQGCAELTSVILPDSVERIGMAAFQSCSSLTEIAIPASVTQIGDYAFDGTEQLAAIAVAPENPAYLTVDGVLFDKDRTTLIKYPEACAETSYTVPDTCTQIEDWAFIGAQYLEQLDLGQVTQIGSDAFYYCVGLRSVSVPEGVRVLSGAAFGCCFALEEVQLPSTLEEIGEQCFYGCISLTRINLPESLTYIRPYAFLSCTSLRSLTVPEGVVTMTAYCMGYQEDDATGSIVVQDDFTMYVTKKSAAYQYASSNGISYKLVQAQNDTLYYILIAVAGVIIAALAAAIIVVLKRRRSS